MHQAEHADRARDELHEVPDRLDPVRCDPAPYAIHAAEQALYRRVTITCDGGTVLVRTTSGWGKRETAFETLGQLNRGFEASGMNLFLRAHGHSSARTRERAIQAMDDGGQRVILDVEPRRPPQRAEPLAVEVPPRRRGRPRCSVGSWCGPAEPVARQSHDPGAGREVRHRRVGGINGGTGGHAVCRRRPTYRGARIMFKAACVEVGGSRWWGPSLAGAAVGLIVAVGLMAGPGAVTAAAQARERGRGVHRGPGRQRLVGLRRPSAASATASASRA